MYQIRFRLKLRPRFRWGSLQLSPNLLAGFEGPILLRGGREGERKERKGEEKRGEVENGKGEGTGVSIPIPSERSLRPVKNREKIFFLMRVFTEI